MEKQYNISKSTFLKGTQCLKSIYLHFKKPELKSPMTFEQQVIIDKGTDVGILARELYRGGIDLTRNGQIKFPELAIETSEAIQGKQQIFYEAGFATTSNLRFQADIFVTSEKTSRLYEVKSSTKIKLPQHILDLGFQWYVLQESGYDRPLEAYLVYLSRDYILEDKLDMDQLFVFENVTQRVKDIQVLIKRYLLQIDKTIKSNKAPAVSIGEHCFKPYECEFKNHCWKEKAVPSLSVLDIGGIRKEKAFKLFDDGIVELNQVPRDITLNEKQWIEVDATIQDKASINYPKISEFLNSIDGQCLYLDFESMMPAVPIYKGTRPYQQLCFQYCLIIKNGKETIKREFLADYGADPRRTFIENLLHDTQHPGHIIVYNKQFEITRLRELAEYFPEYAEEIEERISRVKDLMIPFAERHYYHPSFKGKHSIKKVLPHLVPELSYSELSINNGAIAMAKYESFNKLSLKEQLETKQALLQYCEMDVYGMVKIAEALQTIVNNKTNEK